EDLIRGEYVAPRTDTDRKLVGIWQEVLGLERIGITDNFFELGGHSLMVGQVLNRIHQHLGMQVSFKDFFSSPSIIGITENLELKSYTPISVASSQDNYPLTPSQQRFWVLSQLEGGSQAYNMPSVVKLKGPLHIAYFEQSFQHLINRHEILRTSFKTDDFTGDIRQYISSPEDITFNLEVLDFIDKSDSCVSDYLEGATVEPFDLERSPLLRGSLLLIGDDEHLFFLSMHHIIGDGWSMELLVSEIVETYRSLLRGDSLDLSPLSLQYKDYAVWLSEEIKSDKYQSSESYWLEQFSGEVPVLALPSYRPRPLVQTYHGSTISHLYSLEFTEKLKRYSEAHGATLFMTLMAGVKSLLYRYSGQSDIIVGTPIAGRDHPDLENQLGLYLNTLAIRTRFSSGATTFSSLLDDEKSTLLSAYEHQLYPFDELVGKLNIKRDPSRSALFDVLVVFQNQSQLRLGSKEQDIDGLEVEGYDYVRNTS
ncbi:non-ribosomal peptide synthetase, partial [Chryseobacterium sp. G0240]|uniref:condensation domain-containing protein n=1 Tax=Chryseobacterium sp. G0240 TaxID=2487066 RepID=UPI000F91347E